MVKKIDETGNRHGKLTVIKEHQYKDKDNRVVWECVCDCGNTCNVNGKHLRNGAVKSCGCLRALYPRTCIGGKRERLYTIWNGMVKRCHDRRSAMYKNYGARGIKICTEWKFNYKEFKKWALLNGYNDDLQIDRINNDAGYSPENCRFVTSMINTHNTRILKKNNSTGAVGVWKGKNGIYNVGVEHRGEKIRKSGFTKIADAVAYRNKIIKDRKWPHNIQKVEDFL